MVHWSDAVFAVAVNPGVDMSLPNEQQVATLLLLGVAALKLLI